jgi:hypothetical protein
MFEVFEPPTGGINAAPPAAKRKPACGLKREDGAYRLERSEPQSPSLRRGWGR